jgi:hypothetical protein
LPARIAIAGAGSAYMPDVIRGVLARAADLAGSELVLHDLDAGRWRRPCHAAAPGAGQGAGAAAEPYARYYSLDDVLGELRAGPTTEAILAEGPRARRAHLPQFFPAG